MNLEDKDKKYLGRDSSVNPIEIVRSKGSYLYDDQGKEYIDFLMGWNVGNIGWGVEEVEEKIKNFAGPTYVLPSFLYKPWADLAETLANITPGKLTKSFRATGGTEAVEIALQLAMSHTKRYKLLSVEGSYHGHSIGAMSVGSCGDFRNQYPNLLHDCYTIKPPLNADTGRKVEKILKNQDIAAFILEPIICNLGVVIPTHEFFDIVQAACKKYGTLLIIDEVATGLGRTGKLFASEHYGLEPDIMCLGKAFTGGYAAMGATITTDEVAESFAYDFSFYSTFGWQPLNTVATIANIDYLLKNKLWEGVEEKGKYFEKRLKEMNFKYPADIWVKGLAIGVEFKQPGYALEIVQKCQKNGLLFSDLGPNVFTLFPALNIDDETMKKGLDILKCSI